MKCMSIDKLGGLHASQRHISNFVCLFTVLLILLGKFLHPGHLEGPKECSLGLGVSEQGFIAKQALFGHSLAQCLFSLQRLQGSLLL